MWASGITYEDVLLFKVERPEALDGPLKYSFRNFKGIRSGFRYPLACKTGWDFPGRESHRKMLFQGTSTNLLIQIALPTVIFFSAWLYVCLPVYES